MFELLISVFVFGINAFLFYFIFYKIIYKTILKSSKGTGNLLSISQEEKIAFQQMMLSPNNETVSRYIKALKKLADYALKTPLTKSISMGDQVKYTNAYNVIKNTDTVSKELKEELYRALLIIGISVSK